ncbi:MAG TPA: hypothetical protein VI456_10885 [Polyangia bacterium]
MARANAILIGAIVLTPTIVGAEGYAIYRTLHRSPKQSAEGMPPAETLAQELPAPPPRAVETPTPPPPPRPPEAPPPPSSDDSAAGEADPTTARRQRALYERRAQVIHDADEQVFDTLNLPDAQRAAIRAIDEQYARTLATIANADGDPALPTFTVDSNAEQTRRTAIAGVLGADATQTFNSVERKTKRRVRNQMRPQAQPAQ